MQATFGFKVGTIGTKHIHPKKPYGAPPPKLVVDPAYSTYQIIERANLQDEYLQILE